MEVRHEVVNRPCPAWCIEGASHDFSPGDTAGLVSRCHTHPIRWLQWSHSDGTMPSVSVSLSQAEVAASADGPSVLQPVEVILDRDHCRVRLTGPQARNLAAAICDAADLWDAARQS